MHSSSTRSRRPTSSGIRYDRTSISSLAFTNLGRQWSDWQTTLRAPLGGQVSNAVSQDQIIAPILDNSRVSFRDRLYNLFTSYSNFSEFGTDSYAFNTPLRNVDSLESIHGVLHGLTGSDGHMTYLDYSAYDPIFWLQ